MHNFIQSLNVKFTEQEKQDCLPTACRIIDLFLFSRVNGIISLEVEVADESAFMKMSIDLLLNDADENIMEQVFCCCILSNEYTGVELLNNLLISQGIIALRKCYNPFIVAYIMNSMLGEKYLPELLAMTNKKIDLNLVMDEYLSYLPESDEFQEKLLNLTRLDLSHLLTSTDYQSLAMAFKGCKKSFVNRMRDGAPIGTFIQICQVLSELEFQKETILQYQKAILNNLIELRTIGLIVED